MSDSGHIAMATRKRVAAVARRDDPTDAGVGDEHAVEDRVVALRRPHAERVPGLDDGDARAGPLDEGVHDLRTARGVGVDGVGAEPGPGRAVGAELLAAGEAVAALDPLGVARSTAARGCRCRPRRGRRRTRRRRAAASRIQRSDVSPARSSSAAMPIQYECMVIARRGRRGVAGQATLAGGELGEVEAPRRRGVAGTAAAR